MPTPRKFQVGDRARVAPERLPRYYPPGVRVGRVIRIAEVRPAKAGVKCWYRGGSNGKGLGPFWYRSDDLRRLDEVDLRGGAFLTRGVHPGKPREFENGERRRVGIMTPYACTVPNCGHVRFAHDFGKEACAIPSCSCKRYIPRGFRPLGHCSACDDASSRGTHSFGTIEHP